MLKERARMKGRAGRRIVGRGGTAKSRSGDPPERRYEEAARPNSRTSDRASSSTSHDSNRATDSSKRSQTSSNTGTAIGAQTSVSATSTQTIGHWSVSRYSLERRGVGQRVEENNDGAVLPGGSAAAMWSTRPSSSTSSSINVRSDRSTEYRSHVNISSSKQTVASMTNIPATSAGDIRHYFRP